MKGSKKSHDDASLLCSAAEVSHEMEVGRAQRCKVNQDTEGKHEEAQEECKRKSVNEIVKQFEESSSGHSSDIEANGRAEAVDNLEIHKKEVDDFMTAARKEIKHITTTYELEMEKLKAISEEWKRQFIDGKSQLKAAQKEIESLRLEIERFKSEIKKNIWELDYEVFMCMIAFRFEDLKNLGKEDYIPIMQHVKRVVAEKKMPETRQFTKLPQKFDPYEGYRSGDGKLKKIRKRMASIKGRICKFFSRIIRAKKDVEG